MPFYDYHCSRNGVTLEVLHPLSERLATWGELCERAGVDPGELPLDTPVERLLSGEVGIQSSASPGPAPPRACDRPGGCHCH